MVRTLEPAPGPLCTVYTPGDAEHVYDPPDWESTAHILYRASRETPTSRPRMDSENLLHAIAPTDSSPTKTVTISLDDPGSMSLLFRLLEERLDKHIDENAYVQS